MNEQEPGEVQLEAKFLAIKNSIMEIWKLSDSEWADIYLEVASAQGFEIKQKDGAPSVPEAVIPLEMQEAIYNELYMTYVVAETGEDPLGIFE